MAVFEFPRRPRPGRARTAPRPFELARQMNAARDRQKSLATQRRKLLESLAQLERLSGELESIQGDLERLRAALRGRLPAD